MRHQRATNYDLAARATASLRANLARTALRLLPLTALSPLDADEAGAMLGRDEVLALAAAPMTADSRVVVAGALPPGRMLGRDDAGMAPGRRNAPVLPGEPGATPGFRSAAVAGVDPAVEIGRRLAALAPSPRAALVGTGGGGMAVLLVAAVAVVAVVLDGRAEPATVGRAKVVVGRVEVIAGRDDVREVGGASGVRLDSVVLVREVAAR